MVIVATTTTAAVAVAAAEWIPLVDLLLILTVTPNRTRACVCKQTTPNRKVNNEMGKKSTNSIQQWIVAYSTIFPFPNFVWDRKKVHASLFDSRLLFFSSFHLREKKQQQQPERRQNMHIAHDYTQQQKKKKERKKRKHSLFIFVIIRQTLSI